MTSVCSTCVGNRAKTPVQLSCPSFLMSFPFTLDTRLANNLSMVQKVDREINYEVAFDQFLKLYHYMAKESLVYLLPSEGNFQDQVYVANLGIYLRHIKDRDVILVSNYKSIPRIGEDIVGKKFFHSMGYEVDQSPFCFEGEADLKFLRDNIYFAAYGIRTDIEAHDWMREHYGMEIISLEVRDELLYPLDCSVFPISDSKVLVNTPSLTKEGIRAIERVAEIIDIPESFKYQYITNSLRLGNRLLSDVSGKEPQEFVAKMCQDHGLEAVFFDLSEYWKSGADLSCMVMHLN